MSDYSMENKPLAPDFVPPAQAQQAPPEPETEAFTLSREDWEQYQSQQQALQEQIEQQAQWFQQLQSAAQQPAQQAGPQFDPFSDNPTDQLRSIIREELAPYQQFQQDVSLGEAEERAMDILADLQAEKGEFVSPESSAKVARAMADQFLTETQEQYGYGPQAAEAALVRGYEYAKELETAIGTTAVERHLNQLKTLGGARREPGAITAQASQTHALPQGGDEMSVLRAYGGVGR